MQKTLISLFLFIMFSVNTFAQHVSSTILQGTHGVSSVSFSPDGQILASGGHYDPTIRLWDVATGDTIRRLSGHTGSVLSVSFSPDGQILASGGHDNTIRLWDVATGDTIRTLSGHPGWVLSVSFSPDGQILASGGGVQHHPLVGCCDR